MTAVLSLLFSANVGAVSYGDYDGYRVRGSSFALPPVARPSSVCLYKNASGECMVEQLYHEDPYATYGHDRYGDRPYRGYSSSYEDYNRYGRYDDCVEEHRYDDTDDDDFDDYCDRYRRNRYDDHSYYDDDYYDDEDYYYDDYYDY